MVDEPESEAVSCYLLADGERELVASGLLDTELHCAANCHPDDIDGQPLGIVLDTVSLVDITRGDMHAAGTLPGQLRPNDAIHLAAALRLSVDEVLT